MGFRSVLITEDNGMKVPQWFVDKHGGLRPSPLQEGTTPISSICESKFYDNFLIDERIADMQKILIEEDRSSMIAVLLHECGGITRIKITKDSITSSEPTGWKSVEGVEHSYCYGCSDVKDNLDIKS